MEEENERKFLVLSGPLAFLKNGERKCITEGYLSDYPPIRVRLEQWDERNQCSLTPKIRVARGKKWEIGSKGNITFEEAMVLFGYCLNRIIEKKRYKIGRLEFDVFEGKLEGLVLAEFEWTRPEEEKMEVKFPPRFIVREVTGFIVFDNQILSIFETLPEGWRCKDVSVSS